MSVVSRLGTYCAASSLILRLLGEVVLVPIGTMF